MNRLHSSIQVIANAPYLLANGPTATDWLGVAADVSPRGTMATSR
jgi:hypothetical protein